MEKVLKGREGNTNSTNNSNNNSNNNSKNIISELVVPYSQLHSATYQRELSALQHKIDSSFSSHLTSTRKRTSAFTPAMSQLRKGAQHYIDTLRYIDSL